MMSESYKSSTWNEESPVKFQKHPRMLPFGNLRKLRVPATAVAYLRMRGLVKVVLEIWKVLVVHERLQNDSNCKYRYMLLND
jgi:hypothetical protein